MAKHVTGHKSVQRAFRKLPGAITTPVNQASRFALQPILKAAKQNVRSMGARESGELERSLTIKKDSRLPKSRPVHRVGPSSDSPAVRYAHLVEFGTDPHDGHPGSQPKPFLTQAFAQHDKEAVTRFADKLGPAVEKQAEKLARKQKAGKP